jgi:hypothetical protein
MNWCLSSGIDNESVGIVKKWCYIVKREASIENYCGLLRLSNIINE